MRKKGDQSGCDSPRAVGLPFFVVISMKEKGYVQLHRKLFDNPLWLSEKFTKAQAWVDLFANANHKDNFINIRGNIVEIHRGQLGWSEVAMSLRWCWSKNKVNRFLKWLKMKQQIEIRQDRYITTIITILNYDKYQRRTADDTADGQQTIHKQ